MTFWAWTFVATIVIELAVVAAMVVRAPAVRIRRWLSVCAAANVLTHPVCTLVLWTTNVDWVVVELVVLLVEAALYRALLQTTVLRALVVAVLANGVTASLAIFMS